MGDTIVGDGVCSDVMLTSSLPSCDNSQPSYLMRLQARGFMTFSSIWPIKGEFQRKPLSASAVFFKGPQLAIAPPGQQHASGGVFHYPSTASCSHSADRFPWMYSAALQPPLAHILQTASHAEIQRVLYVSGLPPASLSPPNPNMPLSQFQGAVRGV